MPAWLPLAALVWVAACTAFIAYDPAFTTGRDQVVGAVVGCLFGVFSTALVFAVMRLAILLA